MFELMNTCNLSRGWLYSNHFLRAVNATVWSLPYFKMLLLVLKLNVKLDALYRWSTRFVKAIAAYSWSRASKSTSKTATQKQPTTGSRNKRATDNQKSWRSDRRRDTHGQLSVNRFKRAREQIEALRVVREGCCSRAIQYRWALLQPWNSRLHLKEATLRELLAIYQAKPTPGITLRLGNTNTRLTRHEGAAAVSRIL